jgi:GGDEF domain-containing protein
LASIFLPMHQFIGICLKSIIVVFICILYCIRILLNSPPKIPFSLAEQLRKRVESNVSPVGSNITISLGIGNMPNTANYQLELLNLVDQALYKAKAGGRNRSVIAGVSNDK